MSIALFSDQFLGQVRAGEQMTEEGTVPETAASGPSCTVSCGSEPERTQIALFRISTFDRCEEESR